MTFGGKTSTQTRIARRAALAALTTVATLFCWSQPASARNNYGTSTNGFFGITKSVEETARIYDPYVQIWKEREERFTKKDFAPHGLPIGSLTLKPMIEAATGYDDNVFARPDESLFGNLESQRHDLTGGLKLQSNFARHSFDLTLLGNHAHFTDYSSLDHTDAMARLRFRLDMSHAVSISGFAGSWLEHRDHRFIDRPLNVFEKLPLVTHSASLNIMRNTARFNLGAGITYLERDYRDVEEFNGTPLDRDRLDSTTLGLYTRAGYRFSPGYEAVLRGRTYATDNHGAEPGEDRSSRGFELLAGLDFELTELIAIHVLLGGEMIEFDDDRFGSFSTGVFEARARWLVTPLITLNLSAHYDSSVNLESDAAIRQDLRLGGDIRYRMWRNLTLTTGGEYRITSFDSTDTEYRSVEANVGAEYSLNRNLKFTFDYQYQQRSATDESFDYNRNIFRLGGTLQY